MAGAGQGGAEVLDQHPGPSMPLANAFRAAVVVVVALALGTGMGTRLAGSAGSGDDVPELVAGQVVRVTDALSTDSGLEVPLRNVGTTPLQVLAVETAPAAGSTVRDRSAPVSIQPGRWRFLPLEVPPGCQAMDTASINVVARGDGGDPVELTLPLPSESRALTDHEATSCDQPSPPTQAELTGLWLVDRDYLVPDQDHLALLVTADGRFRMSSGNVLAGAADRTGRYRVIAGALAFRIAQSSCESCSPGDRVPAQANLLEDGRLHLAFPDETPCGALRGMEWVLSRLAEADEMPRGAP